MAPCYQCFFFTLVLDFGVVRNTEHESQSRKQVRKHWGRECMSRGRSLLSMRGMLLGTQF